VGRIAGVLDGDREDTVWCERIDRVSTGIVILQSILGLAAMALNIGYWWLVVSRWEGRFRRWCERRYEVSIKLAGRGGWQVVGARPWYQRLGIELLQLAYFMGAFLVWGVAIVLVIVVMAALSP
jgi:hypothetical protein